MAIFDAPPVRTAFPDAKAWQGTGTPAWAWVKWFQAITDRFNALFVTPPIVTGSRGGNVALTNLLQSLDRQGYIKDSTTP